MPEGDTIYRTARALNRALTGKPITRFESSYAQLTAAGRREPTVVGESACGSDANR